MKITLNRREFIRAGSGALAAVALAPSRLGAADSAAAPRKRKIRKAIMYGTVGLKGSVLEKFKAIKEAGFEGVEPMSHMNQEAVVKREVTYADAYKRSQEEIRKAIPLAEELGVKIAIENVWNHFLLSPLEAARYVDEFNSPWVGWHFDVGNVITYGWPEQWIRVLGKRIQKLHIKEYSRQRRDKEGPWKGFDVPLLEGDNNWPAIMKAL